MAICRFCQREFVSGQAVRAHLKGCAPYLNRPPRQEPQGHSLRDESLRESSLGTQSLGNASREGSEPIPTEGFDPVRQLDQQIAAEQRRLKLRELRQAHDDMDRQAAARERDQQREADKQAEMGRAAQRQQDAAHQRERQDRQARENGANAIHEKQRRRRELIQDVKQAVIEQWPLRAWIGSELKARILLEIERVLAPLPVDELPRNELVQIAQGVRDRLDSEATRAEQNAQRQAQERAERRKRLQQQGLDYAKRDLREVDGLSGLASMQIELRVSRELEGIKGDETSADIEDWVDDILEREGIGYDDDDEEE